MNKIEGFTPASDYLCQEFDPTTALVYGKIWRYWDAYGKCSAANKRISEELSISIRTVIRKIELLEKGGYIERLRDGKDTGSTNVWVPTGKIAYRSIVKEVVEGMTESHTPMPESHRGYDRESHKDTPIERNKEIDSSPAGAAGYFSELEQETPPTKTEKPKTEYVQAMELLEGVFACERGCSLPDWEKDPKGSNKRHRMPLARMWRSADHNIELTSRGVKSIVQQMKDDNLTFDAPDQIEKTFKSWIIDNKNGRSSNGHKPKIITAPQSEQRQSIKALREKELA